MNEATPIHQWTGDGQRIQITRKTSMFGSESIVLLSLGDGSYAYHHSKAAVSLAELANAICEYLEERRDSQGENTP